MSQVVLDGMVVFQDAGSCSEPSTPLASVPAPSEEASSYSDWGEYTLCVLFILRIVFWVIFGHTWTFCNFVFLFVLWSWNQDFENSS